MENTLQTNNNTQPDQNQTDTPTSAEESKTQSTDRTSEQFQKLTESNSSLNEQNANLRRELEAARMAPIDKPIASQQTSLQPNQIPKEIDLNSFVEVDEKTGERFVNETKLTSAISNLQQKTTKAEETIQNYIKTSEDRRIQSQKDEAFGAYPELSPNSDKFDKTFYRTVRAVLYDSMVNADEYGKNMSLREAADYVKGKIIRNPQKEGDMEEAKSAQASAAKAAAGSMIPSQPQNAPQPSMSEDLNRLRLATRQGSVEALAQRILATDHVKKS